MPFALHLDLARELSFSLKPWRFELHEAIATGGRESRQVDLNPHFWRWVLGHSGRDLWGELCDLERGEQSPLAFVERALQACAGVAIPAGRLNLRGLQLEREVVASTASIRAWALDPAVRSALEPWWQSLSATIDFRAHELVTFGVGSLAELALAAWLSNRIRHHHPSTHTCLAWHQWENFTLAPRLPALATNGALLELFDSAVTRGELLGPAIEGLLHALSGGRLDALTNVTITLDGRPRTFEAVERRVTKPFTRPEAFGRYLRESGLPAGQAVLLDAIVRNDCWYGRCAFCTQNAGYARHQHYQHDPEIIRVLALMTAAADEGVRQFSFVDQAVPPALLTRFSERLLAAGLDTRWCVRMLANRVGDEPLALARRAGCREVLYGVETLDQESLRRIDKHTTASSVEGLHQLLGRLQVHGIDATLSFIRGLPGETPESFDGSTGAFVREVSHRYSHVTTIVNDFEVYLGTPMERSPEAYGLHLERGGHELEFRVRHIDPSWHAAPKTALLGVASGLTDQVVEAWHALHYSSIGLSHRWRTGRWLQREVTTNVSQRDTVVLGSTGYLGKNLMHSLPAGQLVGTSTHRPTSELPAPHVVADLSVSWAPLEHLSPRAAWVCARPRDLTPERPDRFLMHLMQLLRMWVKRGHLKRLVVFSTQLVMRTPLPGERASGRWRLEPQDDYGARLAQLEVFAGALGREHGLSVDIVRLPLVYGGLLDALDRTQQLLPAWFKALSEGARFPIDTDADRRFGNSWVQVTDLIAALQSDEGPGIRVRTASSGDFRYADLQVPFGDGAEKSLRLFRTEFFLEDELDLPPRDLMSESTPVV